jgi:prepilin peptidase CpaA
MAHFIITWSVICIACVAATFDLLIRRVPNSLALTGLLIGLGSAFFYQGTTGLLAAGQGIAIALMCLLPGYLLGFTGGGDVKLAMAFGALLGSRLTLYGIALSFLIAACWGLIAAIHAWRHRGAALPFARYGRLISSLFHGQPSYQAPPPTEAVGIHIPFAPALALGHSIVMLWFWQQPTWLPSC